MPNAYIPPADRLAATDTLHRYGHAYDGGDFDMLGDCFTVDATFTIATTVGSMPSAMHGRQEIVSSMRRRREETQPAQRRHLISNVILDPTDSPDRLRARCYLLAASTESRLSLLSTGTYDDVLARTDEGWQIAERILTLDNTIA